MNHLFKNSKSTLNYYFNSKPFIRYQSSINRPYFIVHSKVSTPFTLNQTVKESFAKEDEQKSTGIRKRQFSSFIIMNQKINPLRKARGYGDPVDIPLPSTPPSTPAPSPTSSTTIMTNADTGAGTDNSSIGSTNHNITTTTVTSTNEPSAITPETSNTDDKTCPDPIASHIEETSERDDVDIISKHHWGCTQRFLTEEDAYGKTGPCSSDLTEKSAQHQFDNEEERLKEMSSEYLGS